MIVVISTKEIRVKSSELSVITEMKSFKLSLLKMID